MDTLALQEIEYENDSEGSNSARGRFNVAEHGKEEIARWLALKRQRDIHSNAWRERKVLKAAQKERQFVRGEKKTTTFSSTIEEENENDKENENNFESHNEDEENSAGIGKSLKRERKYAKMNSESSTDSEDFAYDTLITRGGIKKKANVSEEVFGTETNKQYRIGFASTVPLNNDNINKENNNTTNNTNTINTNTNNSKTTYPDSVFLDKSPFRAHSVPESSKGEKWKEMEEKEKKRRENVRRDSKAKTMQMIRPFAFDERYKGEKESLV